MWGRTCHCPMLPSSPARDPGPHVGYREGCVHTRHAAVVCLIKDSSFKKKKKSRLQTTWLVKILFVTLCVCMREGERGTIAH